MTDFELAIMNACANVFPEVPVSACFFHLNQSIYREIQSEGLEEAYNNADNRQLKTQTHMLMALAFVPVNDEKRYFEILRDEVVDELLPTMEYFDAFYITGRPTRGR